MTTASKDAYIAIVDHLPKKRKAVWEVIADQGDYGATIREACSIRSWPYNTVSARFHELAEEGFIMPRNGSDTRDGQTVWVLTPAAQVEGRRMMRQAARRARKSPRVKRLEEALRTAIEKAEAYIRSNHIGTKNYDGALATLDAERAALNDMPWPQKEA